MEKKRVLRDNRKKSPGQQRVALERISELFEQARKMYSKDKSLSNKYASLARKIALKYKVSFSKEQKMQFCKECSSFLVLGENARVRINDGKLVVKCLECNSIRRFAYK